MISHQYEQVFRAAQECAKQAMSLEDRVAAQHGATYWMQQRPEGLDLEDVVAFFKQAFEEARVDEAELDSYDEEE